MLIFRISSSRVLPSSQYKCDCYCPNYPNLLVQNAEHIWSSFCATPTASCQSQVKGLEVTLPTRDETVVEAVLLLKAGLCFLLPRNIAAVTVSSTANVCPLALLSCDVPCGCSPWAFVHIRLLSIVFPSVHAATK